MAFFPDDNQEKTPHIFGGVSSIFWILFLLRVKKKQTSVFHGNLLKSMTLVHDISDELHAAYKNSNNFIEELTKISDRYYDEIKQTG